MKRLITLLLIAPLLSYAQNKNAYNITGKITGFPDGTSVSFFNRETNELDSVTEFKNNTFVIQGTKLAEPEFKFLAFNKQGPLIPVLTYNETITLEGSNENLDSLNFSGSKLQTEYRILEQRLTPFNEIIATQRFTAENVDHIFETCSDFIKEYPSSFVSLLALTQAFQISQKARESDKLLHTIDKEQRKTQLGIMLGQQIAVAAASGIGSPIKSFSQKDENGKLVKITDFKGQYVLIDFWASWCGPCRMENPNVVANYNRFKDKNFTVLGVSLDNSKSAWLKAIKADNLTWPQVSDLKGWQNEVSTMFNIRSIPANILIDPDGVIIAKNIRGQQLGQTLEKILGDQ